MAGTAPGWWLLFESDRKRDRFDQIREEIGELNAALVDVTELDARDLEYLRKRAVSVARGFKRIHESMAGHYD